MMVTINLKPEIEKLVAEKAKENGLQIETYLEVFIEKRLEDESETSIDNEKKSLSETAVTEEWFIKFHKWLDSRKDGGEPFLSDEALRRENIYEDRF